MVRARDRTGEGFPQIHCAYESHPMYGILIVPREMAYTRCDSDLHPMPFDHVGMVQVKGPDEDPYLWAMARILAASAEFSERQSFYQGQ
jgi:hypothetical protein